MGKYQRPKRGGNQSRKAQQKLNDAPTPAEALFARQLTQMNIKYQQNYIVRTARSNAGYYLVDFWLPKHRTFVELDGQPHVSEQAQWKDKLRTEDILEAVPDARLARLWNHEVITNPYDAVLQILKYHE
jgi:very-short-patch-repair endonuclease